MNQEFVSIIISGSFGLIAAIVSGIVSYRSAVNKLRKELEGQLVEGLLEKRLATYPQLLTITQDLGKKSVYENGVKKTLPLKTQVTNRRQALIELRAWESTSLGYLILSKEALHNYYQLKDELKKNPATKSAFSQAQMKKMFEARNALRGSLREDIGIYHTADLENRN